MREKPDLVKLWILVIHDTSLTIPFIQSRTDQSNYLRQEARTGRSISGVAHSSTAGRSKKNLVGPRSADPDPEEAVFALADGAIHRACFFQSNHLSNSNIDLKMISILRGQW